MELTRKQIEDYRKENTMYPPAALEDWGVEENLILNTLCDYYLAQLDTGTEPRPSSVE